MGKHWFMPPRAESSEVGGHTTIMPTAAHQGTILSKPAAHKNSPEITKSLGRPVKIVAPSPRCLVPLSKSETDVFVWQTGATPKMVNRVISAPWSKCHQCNCALECFGMSGCPSFPEAPELSVGHAARDVFSREWTASWVTLDSRLPR